jgi:hypothetical protein
MLLTRKIKPLNTHFMKNSNLEILPFLLSSLLATLRQAILGRDIHIAHDCVVGDNCIIAKSWFYCATNWRATRNHRRIFNGGMNVSKAVKNIQETMPESPIKKKY